MKKIKHYFNLIEIVLTIAVVAFGVVVILGMLPKGMTASRNVAAVSYASSVIDQMGGALQQHGAGSIESTSFDDNAKNDGAIMKDYTTLVEYIDNLSAMSSDLKNKYKPFSTGVFKCTDHKDVYIVVMGNSEEVDGERVNNLDFSGMLRVCKEESPEGQIIKLDHDSGDDHKCLNDTNGNLACDLIADKHEFDTVTVYMELSYPLSRPYDERQKMYYSFDVKK